MITVDGDTQVARALLRSLICQLAVLHGPDHIVISAVVSAETSNEWDWLKWLPHHQHVLPEGGVEQRHVVMILDGGDWSGLERELYEGNSATIVEIGMSLETAAYTKRLQLRVNAETVTVRAQDGDEVIARPDLLSMTQASACARRLTQYRPASDGHDGAARLAGPDGYRQHRFDPENYWETADDRHIKPVPIGVAEDGTRVQLDINEAARNGMGPHGLCVGATGSGKSELLRTLALGMITSHPPDVLNLILVDFKGGATFLGLERARHVGAVITNLAGEAHLVEQDERCAGRRDEAAPGATSSGGTIREHLAEYRPCTVAGCRCYRHCPRCSSWWTSSPNCSASIPISPNCSSTIGRFGRSLGMHLLLASQRLDEGRLRGLETHLSYRICLKTFSAGESRAVLGVRRCLSPAGHTGAAYLKSASGDLVRFQTAFVSGREPATAQRAGVPGDSAVETTRVHRFTGGKDQRAAYRHSRTRSHNLGRRIELRGGPRPTRTSGVAAAVDRLADARHVDARADRRSLTVPIGVVDNPYEQRRDPLVVELDGSAGNVAFVGAPRSGKSTALRTMLLALAETHDPADLGFYCLDFGGGALVLAEATAPCGLGGGACWTSTCVAAPLRRWLRCYGGGRHCSADAGSIRSPTIGADEPPDCRVLPRTRSATWFWSSTVGRRCDKNSTSLRGRSQRLPPRVFRSVFMSLSRHRAGLNCGPR